MLDFYFIKDTTPSSGHGLSKQDYAGGIEADQFEHLQEIHIIEAWLDYYKDFRWTSEQVVKKYTTLAEYVNARRLSKDSPEGILLSILQKANDVQSGLIAFSD